MPLRIFKTGQYHDLGHGLPEESTLTGLFEMGLIFCELGYSAYEKGKCWGCILDFFKTKEQAEAFKKSHPHKDLKIKQIVKLFHSRTKKFIGLTVLNQFSVSQRNIITKGATPCQHLASNN